MDPRRRGVRAGILDLIAVFVHAYTAVPQPDPSRQGERRDWRESARKLQQLDGTVRRCPARRRERPHHAGGE